jgi:hypothetical protein
MKGQCICCSKWSNELNPDGLCPKCIEEDD